MHNKEFSQIPVEHEETSLKEIVDKVLERRKMNRRGAFSTHFQLLLQETDIPPALQFYMSKTEFILSHHFCAGLAYRLEKQDQPGVSVDLDSQVKSLETFEFCLVRENSESVKLASST